MDKSMKKNNDKNPSYFLFDFDPSQFEDYEILDTFYSNKFKELQNRRDIEIYNKIPSEIKTNDNTGCLIGRNLTSNLRTIIKMFNGKRIESDKILKKEVNVILLKNFKYLDGQVRNSSIMVRVVKEQYINNSIKENSFNLIHFYHQVLNQSQIQIKGQQARRSSRQKAIIEQINKISLFDYKKQLELQNKNKQEDIPRNLKMKEEDKDQYNNKVNIKSKTDENSCQSNLYTNNMIVLNNGVHNNSAELEDQINMDDNNQLTEHQETLSSISKNERNNNLDRLKIEMKKEYLKLDVEEQKNIAEQEAKYYKDQYIKELIKTKQQSQKILDMEIIQQKQQLSRNSMTQQQQIKEGDITSIIID